MDVTIPDRCGHREYSHSGDLGDIVFGLATIKECGGADVLYLCDYPGRTSAPMDADRFAAIKPLIEAQPYVHRVVHSPDKIVSSNLDGFRHHLGGRRTLISAHAGTMGIPHETIMRVVPWLECGRRAVADVVIARSPRYHGDDFKWGTVLIILQELGHTVVFMGLPDEHSAFISEFGIFVPYLPTGNLLEAAEVISGAKLFCGNQTCLHAIADGLGKPIIMEASSHRNQADTCCMGRANALAIRSVS